MASLLEKIENAYNYCKFATEERERRNLINSLNRSLDNLTKNLCKYFFLKIVLEEISLLDLKKDVFVQKVSKLDEYFREILATADKFKEEQEKCQEAVNQITTEITRSVEELLINVTNKMSQLNSILNEKRTLININAVAKVLGINQETINTAEILIKDFQQRIKHEIFLEDVAWINDEISKFSKLMREINEKASEEKIREKMKLTEDEAEVVSKLISGESVPLTKISEPLLKKIKEFFGDVAKITITS